MEEITKEKVQQALCEHLLRLKEEAEKYTLKPIDALMCAEAMKKICEAMVNVNTNLN